MPALVPLVFAASLGLASALCQEEGADPPPVPAELFSAQDPPKVVPRLLDGADVAAASIHVSLGRQRAYLTIGNEVAIDTPVCTGKPRAMTPKGQFSVLEKITTYSSSLYGHYLDGEGRLVRASASARTDVAPAGATFRAVPVEYYLRIDDNGLALHSGPLPGYPASDTAVRLPADIAPLFFQRVKVGTPVKIAD